MKRKLSIVLKATGTKDTKFYRGNITSLVESSPLDTLGLIGRHPGQLCGYSKAYKEHIHECMHAYDLYRRVGCTRVLEFVQHSLACITEVYLFFP